MSEIDQVHLRAVMLFMSEMSEIIIILKKTLIVNITRWAATSLGVSRLVSISRLLTSHHVPSSQLAQSLTDGKIDTQKFFYFQSFRYSYICYDLFPLLLLMTLSLGVWLNKWYVGYFTVLCQQIHVPVKYESSAFSKVWKCNLLVPFIRPDFQEMQNILSH